MRYKGGVTPYYKAVIEALKTAAGEGSKRLTQYEIAALIGRNITKSLRRALENAERDSFITRRDEYSALGGLMAVYDLHVESGILPSDEPPI